MIRRLSSRRQPLGRSFLVERLRGADRYDRIAGYFTGSVLEIAGEAIESVSGAVRVVCNSQVRSEDVATARAAAQAQRGEWCASAPETLGEHARPRFALLYELLKSKKLVVRVLPNVYFGLVHGKAGVIRHGDRATSFLGSVNETREGWTAHHELMWEDDSPEAVSWVQEEFDALFDHAAAVPLAEFVIEDIGRLARRKVLGSVEGWRDDPDPAPVAVEAPVYRREAGLWQHQKHFISLAFDAHRNRGGARYVLADQVGLGKTVQLAMAAQLMVLVGDRPALVLAPRTLIGQWQTELRELLAVPSARWTGRSWIDESGVDHPTGPGADGIVKCPRRIGIVSHGIVLSGRPEQRDALLRREWECVVMDEAHRARRRNLGPGTLSERADPNRLLAFLQEIAPRTRSLLLATATPVQLHPVEAHDLLDVLARGTETVLGNRWSNWRSAERALAIAQGDEPLPSLPQEAWSWMRNPLPPPQEDPSIDALRRALGLTGDVAVADAGSFERLRPPDVERVTRLSARFGLDHNPFIRSIVRRTRAYLEETLDPETHEPLLAPVRVELSGEGADDAIALTPYLEDAYDAAETFCAAIAKRVRGAGFLQTLLLRRVGSTIEAGRITAERMLGSWRDVPEDDEDDERGAERDELEGMTRTITPSERTELERFLLALRAAGDADPKLARVRKLLFDDGWLDDGCILFSQYLDSVRWIGARLSTEHPELTIGLYAGSGRSGLYQAGAFESAERDRLRERVRDGSIRLLLGTDAASEGLNLQRLGTLINLDLPWNPTRLEQRKGRIQRIGQARPVVRVHNMRYRGSVEDRVHQLLSQRLADIFRLFGQIPDVLEDAWIDVALGDIEAARQRIDALPRRHPFEIRYRDPGTALRWERCAEVLGDVARKAALRAPW